MSKDSEVAYRYTPPVRFVDRFTWCVFGACILISAMCMAGSWWAVYRLSRRALSWVNGDAMDADASYFLFSIWSSVLCVAVPDFIVVMLDIVRCLAVERRDARASLSSATPPDSPTAESVKHRDRWPSRLDDRAVAETSRVPVDDACPPQGP